MSTVLTVGTFDTPHGGHVRFLHHCRIIANLTPRYSYNPMYGEVTKLIVGVNTDDFVRRFKRVTPAYPFEQRKAVIAGLASVTEVIGNSSDDLKPLLAKIKPDFLIVGSDWAKKDYYAQIGASQQWLDDHNIVLLYIPYTEGVSSTQLRERILSD